MSNSSFLLFYTLIVFDLITTLSSTCETGVGYSNVSHISIFICPTDRFVYILFYIYICCCSSYTQFIKYSLCRVVFSSFSLFIMRKDFSHCQGFSRRHLWWDLWLLMLLANFINGISQWWFEVVIMSLVGVVYHEWKKKLIHNLYEQYILRIKNITE